MADAYGPLALPIPAPSAGQAVADPLLDYTLGFFKAILNAKASAAWAVVDPAHPQCVVGTFTHDPNEVKFNTRDLPALFLWRSMNDDEYWLAADFFIRPSQLTLLWIPPVATQDKKALRAPFFNAIHSVIDGVIELAGRDPSYIVPGDTDPNASTQGSLLWHFLTNVFEFSVGRSERVKVQIVMADKSPGETYEAVRTIISIKERLVEDRAVHADVFDGGVSGQVLENPDLVAETFQFGIAVRSITPTTGPQIGGTAVTIYGVQFVQGCTVTIGGVACTNVAFVDSTQITCTTGAHGAGLVSVVVTNPAGDTSAPANLFTYV